MAEDNRDSTPKEHKIQPDAPVMHVPAVHLYALGIVDVAASAGLPHAGDARFDCQSDSVVQLIEIGFGNQRRPCA